MAELRKHPRHLYYAIEDEILYSVYSTIRGERFMGALEVPGLRDSRRLTDLEVEAIKEKYKI
jgi:hypothetical protein